MATEIRIASGEKGSGIEGFGTRGKYMPKGVTRGGEGGPGAPPARPGGGPRGQAAWAAPGSPLAPLLARGSFWSADFYIFFPEFFWQFK